MPPFTDPRRSLKPEGLLVGHGALTHETLCTDPLLIFRCDDRALRDPILLEILLSITSAYTVASRALVQAHAQGPDREDMGRRLLLMQQSAVVGKRRKGKKKKKKKKGGKGRETQPKIFPREWEWVYD